jgi:hypothetical protein
MPPKSAAIFSPIEIFERRQTWILCPQAEDLPPPGGIGKNIFLYIAHRFKNVLRREVTEHAGEFVVYLDELPLHRGLENRQTGVLEQAAVAPFAFFQGRGCCFYFCTIAEINNQSLKPGFRKPIDAGPVDPFQLVILTFNPYLKGDFFSGCVNISANNLRAGFKSSGQIRSNILAERIFESGKPEMTFAEGLR